MRVQAIPRGQDCQSFAKRDLSGGKIASRDVGGTPNETAMIRWDGKSKTGTDLPAGMYVFRMMTSEGSWIQPVLKTR
jgi:hypothetical protein